MISLGILPSLATELLYRWHQHISVRSNNKRLKGKGGKIKRRNISFTLLEY